MTDETIEQLKDDLKRAYKLQVEASATLSLVLNKLREDETDKSK